MNPHLDKQCLRSPRPEASHQVSNTRQGFGQPQPTRPKPHSPQRLPALNYHGMKESALRGKLRELKLPAHGSKQEMVGRHKEWILLHNANTDATRPKTSAELRKDLETWERTAGNLSGAARTAGAEIKAKEFDREGWSSNHSHAFQNLIAQARKTMDQARAKKTESSEAAGSTPASHTSPVGASDLPGPTEERPIGGLPSGGREMGEAIPP